jgi:transcriptional regulator with PAS, ATPase and Fis domain
MAAIPNTMFEREFFGHHKGAFSGADRDIPGYVAQADGGTLFLDEIGECPVELQPKLLRLLQEGTYLSLGRPEEKRANVRLLAATNMNLGELVERGGFRQDLYYRLKVLELHIPPLRERIADILPLLVHFLGIAADHKVSVHEYFNKHSVRAIKRYPWPGNVREIAAVARRAHICLTNQGRVRFEIGIEPKRVLLSGPQDIVEDSDDDTPADDIARSRILVAMEEAEGNRSEAARRLKISRATLYRRIKKLGIKL